MATGTKRAPRTEAQRVAAEPLTTVTPSVAEWKARQTAGIRDWLRSLPPACGCGARKQRCDDCGAWWCGAPGHPRHTCGGEPRP
jgi:hypothetical protein